MIKQRVAIVTGAGSGIGRATALRLAAQGDRTVLLDRDGAAAKRVATEIGDTASAYAVDVDVVDTAAINAAVDKVSEAFGRIDILINNAGGGSGARLLEVDAENWDAMLALNVTSALRLIQAVAPVMARGGGGAIVNVASLAARFASPKGGAGYSAAKAALLALSRQAASELAPSGIRVNSVLPGPTRTELTRASLRTDQSFPLGRWVEAEDIAAAIAFLAGDSARMCTGVELVVDGGFSLALG